MRIAAIPLAGVVAMATLAGCARTLPDHDNRIFTTPTMAKVSPSALAQAYRTDASAADRQYRGHAIEVSGRVREFSKEPGARPFVLFLEQGAEAGVRANLHEDRAAEVLQDIEEGKRITLKCFCEQFAEHVILKSCVAVAAPGDAPSVKRP